MGYIVYHLSRSGNRDSIFEKGLELSSYNGKSINYKNKIFVTNSKKRLFFDWFQPGRDGVDVWQIEDEQPLFNDLTMHETGHYYVLNPIPPSKLKLIKCY